MDIDPRYTIPGILNRLKAEKILVECAYKDIMAVADAEWVNSNIYPAVLDTLRDLGILRAFFDVKVQEFERASEGNTGPKVSTELPEQAHQKPERLFGLDK